MSRQVKHRFSGHETFPCRYGWLPKAARAIDCKPELFSSEDDAMIALGIGKNMVRSLRFWVEVTGIAASTTGRQLAVTDFGRALLLGDAALDPYIEDLQTLWLLHWQLVTRPTPPLFAWDFLFNSWHSPLLVPSEILHEFHQQSMQQGRGKALSKVTLKQHLDVFIRTYLPARGAKDSIVEDSLDSPLTELRLLQDVGTVKKQSAAKATEPAYSFRRERKPELRPELFLFCVMEFWQTRHAREDTLSFDQIAYGHGSPGQAFKLPDHEIRDRLNEVERQSDGRLAFQESLQTQQLVRTGPVSDFITLGSIYGR